MSKDPGYSKIDSQGSRIRDLESEINELKETHGMQLAGISVVSLCNTEESLSKQEIQKDNPYWTVAFEDVRTAMEREIELIAENKKLRDFLTKSELEKLWHKTPEYDHNDPIGDFIDAIVKELRDEV